MRADGATASRLAPLAVAALACVLASGCDRRDPDPPVTHDDELGAGLAHPPEELAAYLRGVVGADLATRQREVASWKLGEAAWDRTVVPAYRDAYDAYAAAFDAAAPALIAQLAARGDVRARRHFADDPVATRAQVRLRWAVPVLYPSAVATIAGAPIDTAFVADGDHWRALLGLPEVVLARARAIDPACADHLAAAGPPGPCTDVGWLVADTAMRADREAFTRACALAAARCR